MSEPFLIAFRESFQCSVLAALVLLFPLIREEKGFIRSFLAGILVAFLAGFPLGYVPFLSRHLLANETWTFWRYVAESVMFYLSVVVVIRRPNLTPITASRALFALGMMLFFFEARGLGFLIHDMGVMTESMTMTLVAALAGTGAGFLPFFLARRYLPQLPLRTAHVLPILFMVIGALQFAFGGLGELEKENILIPLQRGLLDFVGNAVQSMQRVLLVPEHPFLDVAFDGFARFMAGDRIALMLALLFFMTPPVFILIHLFSRPDPLVGDIAANAQRRQVIALFRKELFYQTIPVLTAFGMLVVLLHAVNISMNPLYDPSPVPVRATETTNTLRIPLSDKMGDLSDKKLRKYVYYQGNKQILFLAILKADGSLGVALDQCEICRPADWNKDAKGYAQKGEHLICKYCMTPISSSTVNNPGGCNPIPVPFKLEDRSIVILSDDLVTTFTKAEALDKKGTHL